MQKSKIAINRVREILDVKPAFKKLGSVVFEENEIRGDIGFEGVNFAYEEKEPVLRNLSFQIPHGKMTALVGPSGVGKSTICYLVMRLFDPDSGRITLDGNDYRELNLEWLRKQVGMVSQDPFLFHTSILENIRFSNVQASDENVIEAAKASCIHDFIQSLPEGYATVVGDRGIRLSGGQRQRISIARSILLKPKILILDEATAFLDTSVEERLKETLGELMKGRTIVVISHRSSTIEGADKIIALKDGGLLYEGSAQGFFRQMAVHPGHHELKQEDMLVYTSK